MRFQQQPRPRVLTVGDTDDIVDQFGLADPVPPAEIGGEAEPDAEFQPAEPRLAVGIVGKFVLRPFELLFDDRAVGPGGNRLGLLRDRRGA